MEEYVQAGGRTTLQSSPRWAMGYGPDGLGAPGVEFARRHGYGLKLVEAKRRLALPVVTELVDELEARVDPAYSIRAFAGPIPEDRAYGHLAVSEFAYIRERWILDCALLAAPVPQHGAAGGTEAHGTVSGSAG